MDAKTFISKKHDAAVDDLKAIEAEYLPRLEAAKSAIAMTKKWLEELGVEKGPEESPLSLQDVAKSAANTWVSSRDLNPTSRPTPP